MLRFKFKMVLAVLCVTLLLPMTVAFAESDAKEPAGVAKVGNLVITQADIDRRAQQIMPMQVGLHGSVGAEKVAEIKQKALDDLAERAYKVQYAIEEEISIDADDFEQEWQKRLSDNPQLVQYSQSPEFSKIKADLYLNLLARKAEKVAVNDQVKVSDQEVAAHYAANKQKFFRPKLFKASHVFVKVDPSSNADDKEAKRARAEELFRRAKSGEDFYNLAYFESDDRSKYVGGSLGAFHAGQTVPEFDAAIQAMQPGDIVGPVRTIYGFHVIKMDAVEEERQLQLSEVADKIRANLVELERAQLYEKWMSTLKAKYPIERLQ